MITQQDKDCGFDENNVEELMDSFYDAMYHIDQEKEYLGEE